MDTLLGASLGTLEILSGTPLETCYCNGKSVGNPFVRSSSHTRQFQKSDRTFSSRNGCPRQSCQPMHLASMPGRFIRSRVPALLQFIPKLPAHFKQSKTSPHASSCVHGQSLQLLATAGHAKEKGPPVPPAKAVFVCKQAQAKGRKLP